MPDKKIFKNPPAIYRGCPFWALNDELVPKEMSRQVEEFHKAGMGGFFMHSRIGLITEYMGKEWFESLKAAVDKAGELGVHAWLYDEDKWPSGFAGGIVPSQKPEYRQQILLRREKGQQPVSSESKLILQTEKHDYYSLPMPMGNPWFNGTSYVDLMNPDAVSYFLDSTHKRYRDFFINEIGKTVPGIFTDEPGLFAIRPPEGTAGEIRPFSPFLDERYRQNYGESALNHIIELYDDIGDFQKYRYRYYKTMTEQFKEAFSKQYGDWCEKNKMQMTGHYVYEDTVAYQARAIGAAMAHYEYMHVPGIDHLSLNIDNILTPKQCSSIANQTGKKFVLSEMFGCSGQNMSFEDRKWISDWHAQMGINFICHHLALYSLRGCRKRDYPPTFSYHQPYWEHNRIIEDYTARVSYLISEGSFMADFLIINPVESGWCLTNGIGKSSCMTDIDNYLEALLKKMHTIHRDYELADEDFISRNVLFSGEQLGVGLQKYKAVIVPQSCTIRENTIQILERFKKLGGKIIVASEMPNLIDGIPASLEQRLKNISDISIETLEKLGEILEKVIPAKWKIIGTGAEHVYLHRRQLGKKELLFLSNISRKEKSEFFLQSETEGTFTEFNLENGTENNCDGKIFLHPTQSKAILFTAGNKNDFSINTEVESTEIPINGTWKITRHSPNILPLDFAAWSIDGREWHDSEPIIGIKDQLDHDKYEGPLFLKSEFYIEKIEDVKNLELIVESPEIFNAISINEKFLTFSKEYYLDSSFRRTAISPYLKSGKNDIEFKLNFQHGDPANYTNPAGRYGTEIETAYIIGDFGVFGKYGPAENLPVTVFHNKWNQDIPERRVIRLHKNNMSISGEKKSTSDGELTTCGYPFYAGKISLDIEFYIDKVTDAKYKLSLKHLDAIICEVKINGIAADEKIVWNPCETDISKILKTGKNNITLILSTSLRNMLGPHHHSMGELSSVGPYSFVSNDFHVNKDLIPDSHWAKTEKRSTLKSWTDDYFIVRTGIASGVSIRQG